VHVVSFGGGTNSAAMIIGMYKKNIPIDLILFADTGSEMPYTYEFIEVFNSWLCERGLPLITPVGHYTKDGKRLTLEDECLRSNTLPSIAYGYKKCSHKHKISPQDKYCNNHIRCKKIWASGERVHKYIGYDYGEARRVNHAIPHDEVNKKYIVHYPLFDWGWSRDECAEVIMDEGIMLPGKSSCFFCPSMKKHEIKQLWHQYPELFNRAVEIERKAAPTLITVKGLGRKWSWEDFYKATNMQMTLFDFEDAPGGCICGAPCGCYDG